MSRFIEEPCIECAPESDKYFVLHRELIYESDLLKSTVTVPIGFVTDLASIPFGIKWAHREGILHDYLYRIDSIPVISRHTADNVLYEAMGVKGKGFFTKWTIYSGVVLGGWASYHKKVTAWIPWDVKAKV